MAPGLHNSLRPYIPPTIPPEFVAKDKFHPVIRGERTLGISWELEQRTKAVRNQISQGIKQRENIVMPGAEVGVVTLGTGGSLPSKYRNGLLFFSFLLYEWFIFFFSVLSTLIRIPFWGNILLDTGEGAWGQMARHFGLDKDDENSAWQVLRDLKCIFISHMHADHHIGLAQILAKRQLVRDPLL
jgi:ribonuclease Z